MPSPATLFHWLEHGAFDELQDGANHVLLGGICGLGPDVPTDGTAGFCHGAIWFHTDGSDETDAVYSNIGTATSCNFNAMTVASD